MLWKLISWNVNGLRAIQRRGDFWPFVEKEKPDLLCLQEIKIDAEAKDKNNFDFSKYTYNEYWNHAKRPGYSGTASLVKEGLETPRGTLGVGVSEYDDEGRVQTLEFKKFYLLNVYFPNSREDLSRIDFKIDFDEQLLAHVKKLDKKKPVIMTGDYNVANEPIDLARPKENEGKHGYHPREREWFKKLLGTGFVDTFRHLHPEEVKYSWWSTRFGKGARERNIGWRIDYFVVSERLASKIKRADILDKVIGSDHAPVVLEIDI